MAKIKCDYCDKTEKLDDRIPDGWFSGRFRENDGKEAILVKGPTACPFHHTKLKLFFKNDRTDA